MQIAGDRRAGAWIRTRIAPPFTGAIVPARCCELSDFSLDRFPDEPRTCAGRLENHRRTAVARAKDVQRPSADIHGSADLGDTLSILPAPQFLIDNSHCVIA